MLGLRDPVAGPDVVEQEVAVGMDHLAAEGVRHGLHVAARACPSRVRIGVPAFGVV